MRVFVGGLFCLLLAPPAFAQYRDGATHADVDITSSSAGTQVVAAMRSGCTINIAEDETGAVYLVRMQGTAATAVTADNGIRLSRGGDKDPAQWEFKNTDGWGGQIIGILPSGSTAVTVHVNCW